MRQTILRLCLITALSLASLFGQLLQAAEVPVIAAASDLEFALTDIAQQFTQETGLVLKLSFGSSGNFFQQIRRGAPFELFLSADEQLVLNLAAEGLTVDQGCLYALGQLVLFAPKSSPVVPDSELTGLRDALQQGFIKRFAIANPEHAPYGRAAQAVLKASGLWNAMQSHLVLGENVMQAAQFAVSGAAQGGIFAYSIALSPKIKEQGRFVLLPGDLYPPLRQRMVLLKQAGATARAFYSYLQQPSARTVLKGYGFVLP